MAMPIGETANKPQTHLEETISRLDTIRDDAGNITRRLAQMLDRAHGPAPEQGLNAAAPRPVPNGMAGAVMEKLSDIESTLGRSSELIGRLEALI